MAIYGYMRVSSNDGSQRLDRQIDALNKFALENNITYNEIFSDKQSGKDMDRPNYQRMKKQLREGDLVVCLSIDRLGRNYNMITEEWAYITKTVNADIVIIDMPLLDTRTKSTDITRKLISDIVLQLLSYVAETERNNIKERQKEGIASAKSRGVIFGRNARYSKNGIMDDCQYEYESTNATVKELSEKYGIPVITIYKFIKRGNWKKSQTINGTLENDYDILVKTMKEEYKNTPITLSELGHKYDIPYVQLIQICKGWETIYNKRTRELKKAYKK